MSGQLSRIANAAQMLVHELHGMDNATAAAVNAAADPAIASHYYQPLASAGALANLGEPPQTCSVCGDHMILVVGGSMNCRNESQGRHA